MMQRMQIFSSNIKGVCTALEAVCVFLLCKVAIGDRIPNDFHRNDVRKLLKVMIYTMETTRMFIVRRYIHAGAQLKRFPPGRVATLAL
jgi:hypothetical protein